MPVYLLACAIFCVGLLTPLAAAPFPEENGEAVIKEAIVLASSSIVRIETVGGLDVVEGMLASSGPTTGVIVSSDGYIMTSSFNFASNPASVLVSLPDSEERLAAEIVARDHLKQLTLLKIEAEGLTPAQPVPLSEIRVGQWAIALGRTYDPVLPNVSLGLVSALGRVEGRALQTDAKVSPANYGGPLIDLQGRVMGILAPLSPQNKGLTDGMNWYDSGIGFAVPLEQVLESLERLKSGQDLHPGLMGISFLSTPAFMTEPVIQEVRPNSPAAEAGLKTKDVIARVEEQAVASVAALRKQMGRKYADDPLSLTVRRGEEELQVELKLAEKLESFYSGWLGLGPARSSDPAGEGVQIEQIFPDSPAAKAGLQKQDQLVSCDDTPINSLGELRDSLFLKPAGEAVQVKVLRAGKEETLTCTLSGLPEAIPQNVPFPLLTLPEGETPAAAELKTGDLTVPVTGHDRSFRLYVPEDYQPALRYGCLVWLSSAGEGIPADQLAEWKRICRLRGFLLMQPTAAELQPWSTDDTSWLLESLTQLKKDYSVDPDMLCLICAGTNPAFAWQLGLEHRDQFQGLMAFSLPARIQVPFNEPGLRFPVLLSSATEKERELQPKLQQYLQEEGFSALIQERSSALTAEQFDEIGRWLSLLGSL